MTPHSWEFYVLRNDPQELNNCYDGLEYKCTMKELKAELLKQREELNETGVNCPEIQTIVDKHWNE
ncbi:sulfatase/phosphatase domain-containing protein [Labilibacter marinus]|uniref:sulfatase/phosphatase domain-containing protein n=1 Tax=Labilibacter marinus TaxID=1477105 RepID=UPI00094F8AAB|nr:sulfatase/phosphatase domain-containing protein [Labilibacter marinus]